VLWLNSYPQQGTAVSGPTAGPVREPLSTLPQGARLLFVGFSEQFAQGTLSVGCPDYRAAQHKPAQRQLGNRSALDSHSGALATGVVLISLRSGYERRFLPLLFQQGISSATRLRSNHLLLSSQSG
jgi:hypothetical protein